MVIPIEIKSGSNGSLKSLHQFIDASDHPYAIRMYAGSFNVERAITPAKKPYLLMNAVLSVRFAITLRRMVHRAKDVIH